MKKIIGALALIIALSPAIAQESPVRDEQLKGLIQAAVSNYPRIKEMEASLKSGWCERIHHQSRLSSYSKHQSQLSFRCSG